MGQVSGHHHFIDKDMTNYTFSLTTSSERLVISEHLIPTNKKRKQKDGNMINQTNQGYCDICKRETKYN